MGITQQIAPAPQYTSLPPGWDTAWKAAKAAAGSQRVSVVAIGDSVTNGWSASDIMTTSYFAKLRASILASGYTLGGDYFSVLYSAAYATAYGGPGTATPPFVFSGVFGTDHTGHYGEFSMEASAINALSPFCVFTSPYACTALDIIYMDFNAGSWTYQVDGGSAQTVTCTSPGTNAGAILKKISISGLTSGTHTITINATSGGTICNICGISCYAGTTGLCFGNMGLGGMGLYKGTSAGNDLGETIQFPPDRLHLYQGYTGTTASPTALTGFGFPAQPDLAIIAMGINDAINGTVTKTQFRDALDTLIWSLRYGKNDACSIVIVAQWCPDGTLASSTTVRDSDYTGTVYTTYHDIKAAMAEAAQVNNCAFVDVQAMFGRFPVTNGWITSASSLHPTSAGHLKIANLLSSIL